jgi:hypothetical protein
LMYYRASNEDTSLQYLIIALQRPCIDHQTLLFLSQTAIY